MNKIFTLFLGILLCSNLFGQSAGVKNKNWSVIATSGPVTVEYKYEECFLPSAGTHHEYVYLRFINSGNTPVTVISKPELYYNGKCKTCAGSEDIRTLTLDPGETKEGNCSQQCLPELKIFSRMLDRKLSSELTDFKLKNLIVK